MKREKAPAVKFDDGSKQPMLLFFLGVVIVCSIIIIAYLAASGLSFTLGKNLNKGDINSDGKLNSLDALNIMLREKGTVDFSGSQIDAADVDENGRVDADDSVMIIQYSTGETSVLGTSVSQSEPDAAQVVKPYDFAMINTETETDVPQDDKEDTEDDQTEADETDDTDETGETQPQEEQEPEPQFSLSGTTDSVAYVTAENGVYYTARVSNTWIGENGKNMYQIDFTVKNNSEKTVYSTNADVKLSDDSLIEKTNNCSVEKKDDGSLKVTIYNAGAIVPDGSFRCSFVVSSISNITVVSVDKQIIQY